MNQKGFTLVELIAMIVVLGILMVIAVPNISGIIQNSRKEAAIEDFNKMTTLAKSKISTKQYKDPIADNIAGHCVIIPLSELDSNQDIVTGPNGGKYKRENSFIGVGRLGEGGAYKYNYFVLLVEQDRDKNYVFEGSGTDFTKNTDVSSEEINHADLNEAQFHTVLAENGICT